MLSRRAESKFEMAVECLLCEQPLFLLALSDPEDKEGKVGDHCHLIWNCSDAALSN